MLKYFDGIHFPGAYLNINLNNFKDKTTIFSAHSFEEIKKAQNFDFVTFSPIFDSKGRKGLGIKKLNEACKLHKDIIALGGIITDKEAEKIRNSNASGFASIRYFYK